MFQGPVRPNHDVMTQRWRGWRHPDWLVVGRGGSSDRGGAPGSPPGPQRWFGTARPEPPRRSMAARPRPPQRLGAARPHQLRVMALPFPHAPPPAVALARNGNDLTHLARRRLRRPTPIPGTRRWSCHRSSHTPPAPGLALRPAPAAGAATSHPGAAATALPTTRCRVGAGGESSRLPGSGRCHKQTPGARARRWVPRESLCGWVLSRREGQVVTIRQGVPFVPGPGAA